MNLDLSPSTALVTGGAKGIGRAIALSLARAGAELIIADLDQQQAQATADDISAMGRKARALALDVTNQESVKRCIEEAVRHFSHLDILVNNAGIFQSGLGLELQDEAFNRCLDVNLTGIWRVTQTLAPHLKARGGGRIINIASISGRRGIYLSPAYSASKAAVINLTQSLAAALGPDKINVNAICPGGIDTALAKYSLSLLADSSYRSRVDLQQPPKLPLAAPLTAEDIGHAVVFFASHYARSITGQALNVDCGEMMN